MYLGEPQAGRFDSAGYRQWPPLRNIIAHFQILSIIFCKENASRGGSAAKKVRFTESFAGNRLTPMRIRAKMQKNMERKRKSCSAAASNLHIPFTITFLPQTLRVMVIVPRNK